MKNISVFYCLLYAAWTVGTSIKVNGFEKGQVSFYCSHTVARRNNKYFCKDPCEVSKDILVTVEPGRTAESGRITLVDLGDGSFTVTFSQLQLLDSGRYWCAADRPGFDTFIEVHLTVEEVVADKTTVVISDLSPTWATVVLTEESQIHKLISPTPTASNWTNGEEQSNSTGTVLYTTIGAAAILAVLILATCFRKRREASETQPQVCSNSTDFVCAEDREDDCEYNDIDEVVKSAKKLSERFSCTHLLKEGPPTSASTAAESVPLHIYENIYSSKFTADSRYSAETVENVSSVTYISRFPPTISGRTGDGSVGKHTNKPIAARYTSKPTENHTSDGSAFQRGSGSGSKEKRTRSLWFGLDLSGTV